MNAVLRSYMHRARKKPKKKSRWQTSLHNIAVDKRAVVCSRRFALASFACNRMWTLA